MLRNKKIISRTSINIWNYVSKELCCHHPAFRPHKAFNSTLCTKQITSVKSKHIQSDIFNIKYGTIHKRGNGRYPEGLNNRHLGFCSVLIARHNSTDTSTTGNTPIPDGFIPEPPLLPIPEVESATTSVLNALGEPTLSSLGMANFTPSGLIQAALETLHVSCNLPWWGAIIAGTCVIRLCLFPIVIRSQKVSVAYQNNLPTLQRLQMKFSRARSSGNFVEISKASSDVNDFMKRNDVKPFQPFMVPMIQMPIFLSVFIGIRQLANLPVESMTTGGMLWFTDLTIPDPYFLLPIMSMLTLFTVIEIGADGAPSTAMTPKVKWVLRMMPVIMFPFVINFPAAMLCYWATTNVFSLGQVMLLKVPAVRQYFEIPEKIKHEDAGFTEKKGFIEGFKESMENTQFIAEIENRQKIAAERFQKAGIAPVPKTYAYPRKGNKEK